MLKAYRVILSKPGAKRFCVAGAIARFSMSMQAFSIILMISILYGEYALAGQVNAVVVIAFGIGTPILAKLVDRYGQSRIMRPAVTIYSVSFGAMLLAALTGQKPFLLYVIGALVGFFGGTFGAYVRARWTHTLESAKQMNTAFALEAAIDEMIWIGGPIITTILVQSVHPSAGGIACIVFSFGGGIWFLSQKATEPPIQDPVLADQEDKRSLLRNGALLVLCSTFMMLGMVFGSWEISIVDFCRSIGKPLWAGALLAVTASGSLISALVYGARDWLISPLRLFLIGMMMTAASFTLFLWADGLKSMVVFAFICGVAYAPTMTNATNLLREIVPATRFTEGIAWFTTSSTIGASLGTSIAGNILDSRGWQGGMLWTVSVSWGMMLLVLGGILPLRKSLVRARRQRQVRVELALEMSRITSEKFHENQESENSDNDLVISAKGNRWLRLKNHIPKLRQLGLRWKLGIGKKISKVNKTITNTVEDNIEENNLAEPKFSTEDSKSVAKVDQPEDNNPS